MRNIRYRKVCELCGAIFYCRMNYNGLCSEHRGCICLRCNIASYKNATGKEFKENDMFLTLLDACYPDRNLDKDNPSRRD